MLMPLPSVIVGDLDVVGIALAPDEADTPLIVDPNAVLPAAIALQSLHAVARRHAQIGETGAVVEHQQLLPRGAPEICAETSDRHVLEQRLGAPVGKSSDHGVT